MQESMHEICSLIKISNHQDGKKIRLGDGDKKLYFSEQPLFLIDGKFTFDNKTILNLNPKDVKTVEVIHPSYLIKELKGYAPNGIFKINTHHNHQDLELSDNRFNIEIEGYANDDLKVSSRHKPSKSNKPNFEFRPYWNASINTNQNGELIINTYLIPNEKYLLRIEGINHEGRFLSGSKIIEINE